MTCPQCGCDLVRVSNSTPWNDDQWAAVKAGDYYCEACPDNGRGQSGLCYWWKSEVEAHAERACEAIMRS